MMKKITLIAALFAAFSMNAQDVIFEDNFNDTTPGDNVGEDIDVPAGYAQYDVDGDGFSWGIATNDSFNFDYSELYDGNFILSASFITNQTTGGNGGQGALNPNNILVLPQISLPADSEIEFSYTVGSGSDPSFFSETYAVTVTTSDAESDILAATPVLSTTLSEQGSNTVTLDLSDFAGQDVYIAFRHFDTFDQFILVLDDFLVTSETLSVEDFSGNGFSQFVDADANLNLRANVALENVELFNIVGQQVMSQKLSSNDASISLASLTDGVYIARVMVEGQTETFKIIKR